MEFYIVDKLMIFPRKIIIRNAGVIVARGEPSQGSNFALYSPVKQ